MKSPRQYFANFFKVRTLDRTLSSGVRKQFFCLLLFVVLIWGILFGVAKFCEFRPNDLYTQETQTEQRVSTDEFPLWWTVYYHYVNTSVQHQATPETRWFAMLISFIGSIVLTGILISTISNIIERRIDKYKKGLLRYSFTNHIILFGYNDMTPYLIRQLCRNSQGKIPTIVIQTSRPVEELRLKLYSELTSSEKSNVVFVYARRDMEEELIKLRVDKAKEVFVFGESYRENRAEYAHDSLNMDCLNLIGKICKKNKRAKRIKCNVFFNYQATFFAFQFSDIGKELRKYINFCIFNFQEMWAQKVFVGGKSTDGKVKYQPLDRESITIHSEKRVHLVIVGMSSMGIAMAVQAAHIAHYPNFIYKKIKTKITFIDIEADIEMDYFKTQYKNLFDLSHSIYTDIDKPEKNQKHKPSEYYSHLGDDFIDIEWEFIKGNVANPSIQDRINKWANHKNDILTIAICFTYPHTSISCSLYLPESVYKNDVSVLVLQRDSSAVIDNIAGLSLPKQEQEKKRYKNLRPFGMEKDCFDINTPDLLSAKRIKYVYHYYSRYGMLPVQFPSKSELEKLWYDAEPLSKMWANIYNANSILTKLRSVGYSGKDLANILSLTENQIDILYEVGHNRWNLEKLLVGIRPPSEEEDREIRLNLEIKKQEYKEKFVHYDIRPYSELQKIGAGSDANEYFLCLTRALPLIIKKS